MRERWQRSRGAAAGLAVLVALGLLDYVVPRGDWYADHPMSAAALSALLGFFAAGLFLEGWLRERDGRRLDRISTVAYRSLAQFANDAGRGLLAPLNGADLHALGIPGADPGDAPRARSLLARHGHGACFDEGTGSWRTGSAELDPALADLVTDPEFVCRMFLVTATARRRLQEATALWAPVMLTTRSCADDLGRLRELTDALELLQEHWRLSGVVGADPVPWVPPAGWASGVREQFWATIDVYVRIRDDFADLAQLPSDVLVRRRPVPARAPTPARPRLLLRRRQPVS